MQKASLSYLAPLDGLRAVAVVSVLIYHLHPALLPGGFVGVDIFFVISGFVVSGALPASGISGIRQLLGLFYARRATRILPALYVSLFATSLLSLLFIPSSWLSAASEATGIAAVLGYSNFALAHAAGNYFAPRADFNMFTQTWSLGVEEQFYAVFPWLFLPWLTGRRTLSLALVMAGLALSLGFAVFASVTDEVAGFYLVFSRFWELALGVLAFQFSARPERLAARKWLQRASIACAAVIGAAIAFTAPDQTPFPGSLLPCFAIAFLLVLIRTQNESPGLSRLLTLRPMLYLGRISYSLYLWHWPVFVLFRWTVGLSTLLSGSAAIVLASGAAAASYRFVETPPRRALASGRMTARTALAAAAILVGVFYPVEQYVWPLRSTISLSVVSRNRQDWYPDASVKTISPAGCTTRVIVSQERDTAAVVFRRVACPPPKAPAQAIFIVGDSHAQAYSDLLAHYVLTTGAVGTLYYQGGCAVLGLMPNDEAACSAFLTPTIADVERRMKPGDVVFLPGLRIPRIADQYVHFGLQHARDAMFADAQLQWRKASLAATVPIFARLAAEGAVLVLEAPKPEFGAPPFRCADWFNRMNPICADGPTIRRSVIEALRAPVMDEFRAVTDAVPAVRIWDPLPLLCPGDICSAYDNGKPLFFDGDHMSGYANQKLAPLFAAFLRGDGLQARPR